MGREVEKINGERVKERGMRSIGMESIVYDRERKRVGWGSERCAEK